jgi:hypothetical protein
MVRPRAPLTAFKLAHLDGRWSGHLVGKSLGPPMDGSLLLRAAFGRTLDEDRALAVRPRLRLDIETLLSIAPAKHRATTTQTPRRPTRRWRGRGAQPSGLLSVATTDALFAGKVQRKVSNGVAQLAAARSSLEARGPKLRIPNVAAHTGIDGQNSVRFSEICTSFQRDILRRHFWVRVRPPQPRSQVSLS